ncbi:MAG TPA: BON domain-containing protein [Candidatus Aquilonibacter sp.]|nr:BON domain-containing protein [Candidatus Aquilonibacter sp.]
MKQVALSLALAALAGCTQQQQHQTQEQVQSVASSIPSPVKQGARDAALTAAVAGAIAAQAGVNVFHITPSVSDGVVTLKGTAPTVAVKSTILDAVRRVHGVREIVDKVEIRS